MKLLKIIAVALVLTGLSMVDASAANLFQRRHHHYRHHRHYRHYRAHARVDINLPAHPRRLPPPPPAPPRP